MTKEEALQEIKSWDFLEGKEIEAINTLIPELTESEDERMLREIKRYIKEQGDKPTGLPNGTVAVSDMIAYLEKQKEQKPVWKPLEESMEALLLAIEGKWDAIKPTGYMSRRLEDLYDGLVNTFNVEEVYLPKTNYTEKDIEELKTLKSKIDASIEQKPTEWSEEDRKHLNSVLLSLNRPFYNMNEQEKSDFDWLHELPERFNLQPKQEWSEEDEAHRKFILESLEDQIRFCTKDAEGAYYAKQIRTAQNWLKSLRPQQKGEWNEEDEKMFQEALTDIIYAKNELNKKGCEGLAKSALDAFNWLNTRFKSIRHSEK